jgi:diguanylate cyclase (GGDEF)-like protein
LYLKFAGLCFSNGGGIAFQHDLRLAALSYFIASAGSYAALEMIERWRLARKAKARYWQLASAAALGGTIWSMHFIAMLAVKIDVPITYATGTTLLSLLIAIAAVLCGLQIIRTRVSWVRISCAGVTVGLGVAAMHYVGMASIRFAGTLAYTPVLWSLSLLIGVAAATVALWLSLTLRDTWQRAGAALIMGGAICGMHYTGMAAAVFQVRPLALVTPGLQSGPLAAAVAFTTLALIGCALTFVAADRRLLASAKHEAELLRQSNRQLTLANVELELGRQRLAAVLDNMTQGVCFFDGAQRLLVWNRRYAGIYDLPFESICAGLSLEQIVDYRFAAGSTPEMSPSEYLTWRTQIAVSNQASSTIVTLRNGRIVTICHQPMPGGGWVATHEDITEQKRAEAAVVFMARHDGLTGLPNRVMFHERLEQSIDLVGRGTRCAVLCLDLDHFKFVNDTLGHPVGDGLLRGVANRLRDCAREVDTVARLGGDEFAIIQSDVSCANDAELLASRIVTAFHDPFEIDGHHIRTGISIGVAIAPGDGQTAQKLLTNADIALYLAKSEGRGTARFFEPEMDVRIQARRTLELDLRNAIAGDEFEMYYQPLVNLNTGRIIGFEALLRWHHPTRGLVSPMEFIPLAEETGLIVAIGDWVLRTACFEAQGWPEDIRVSVNLSSIQFTKGNVLATVKASLEASGLRPERLELEITESVLLQNSDSTLITLRQLREMGVAVALDDFGTGYSSLSYLRSFPFDKIKVDQSFVRDLVKDKEAMSIIRAVTGLGQSLCMKTTAEGVETLEQLDILRMEGCTEVQGNVFSRPRPAGELPKLIENIHGLGTTSGRVGA